MKKMFTILFVVFTGFCFQNFALGHNKAVYKIITAKGVVRDEEGNALAGATITEKGKSNA